MMQFIACAVAAVIGFAGVARAAPKPAQTMLPIVIGWEADTDWLTPEAMKLHLFEKAGLKASFIRFVAGAPMMAAAESKSIDVAAPGFVPFLAGVGNGIPWVAIAINGDVPRAEGIVAREGSGIHTLADLKGKRIGYFRASTAQYGLYVALKQNHIPLDDVHLLSLAPSAQLAAMRAGQIDAAEVWQPWMYKMQVQAHGEIIATEADLHIHTAAAVYAVRRDWLDTHRETARRFMEALIMAGNAVVENPQIAAHSFAVESGIPDSAALEILKENPAPQPWRWLDPSYDQSIVKGGEVQHALENLAVFLYEQHIIPKEINDVPALLDRSVIEAVLKTQPKTAASGASEHAKK